MPDTKLYTLTEVAQRTKISMPTLQRYKKLYQDRIPSQGSGRSQRYPEEALEVFATLKTENVSRRGRPRKAASAAAAAKPAAPAKRGRKPAAKKAAPAKKAAAQKPAEELLTLTQVGNLTKISYPTLLRYVKNNLKQIPHKGTGRARRYLPGAVEIFKNLRLESKVGRKAGSGKKTAAKAKPAAKKAAAPAHRGPGRPKTVASDAELTSRVKTLEKALQKAENAIVRLEKKLAKPLKAQVVIKGR